MKTEDEIGRQFIEIRGLLHKRAPRESAAYEAADLGYARIGFVHPATGTAPSPIGKCIRQL